VKDEFVNRLSMFQTPLGTLNSTGHKPTWFNQPPLAVTTKVAQAVTALADLEAFVAQYGADITGAAADKKREEEELEVAAYRLGSALAVWFRDQNDETNAATVDRPLSGWRRLRAQTLLEATRLTRDLAQAVVSGPQAAAAADYGITPAAVTALSGEIDDYAAVITAPQQSIAQHKALTQQARARFNAVEAIFISLDSLILQFASTPAGRALIAAHQASRVVRDLGPGPSPTPTPPPPPPSP
jgi:hypothetical protein